MNIYTGNSMNLYTGRLPRSRPVFHKGKEIHMVGRRGGGLRDHGQALRQRSLVLNGKSARFRL